MARPCGEALKAPFLFGYWHGECHGPSPKSRVLAALLFLSVLLDFINLVKQGFACLGFLSYGAASPGSPYLVFAMREGFLLLEEGYR